MGGTMSSALQPVLEYAAPPPPPPPPPTESGNSPLERRYMRIEDEYHSLEHIRDALVQAGLESSNLIVGIDFTKSNEWKGEHSFNGLSLHALGKMPNPYEEALTIIGKTLHSFDEDNLIPSFGFGDWPTSFAPIIEMAMSIVKNSGGQYHILLIIADGEVTSIENGTGQLSLQEQKTVDAIVKASEFPLSIVLVGVGDGPWDKMKSFDDNIPARSFDNFQIMSKNLTKRKKENFFALSALMEIPEQFRAIKSFGYLGWL
ncbi:hypothetical protein EJB05_06311, partial [Eragrostis curvula]